MERFFRSYKNEWMPKIVTQLILMLSMILQLTCVIIITDEDIVTTITWLQHLLKPFKHLTVGAKILDHFNTPYL
jgi:hypothetical protein